jgi:hypothetical protein
MIKEISMYDLPDTKHEPDGYNIKEVADISAANMQVLVDKINELICEFNKVAERVPEWS